MILIVARHQLISATNSKTPHFSLILSSSNSPFKWVSLSLLQSCHTDVRATHHLPISTILYRIYSLFPICHLLFRLISNHHHQCPDSMEDLYIYAAVQGWFLMEFKRQRLCLLRFCSSYIHNNYLSIHLSLLIEIYVLKIN